MNWQKPFLLLGNRTPLVMPAGCPIHSTALHVLTRALSQVKKSKVQPTARAGKGTFYRIEGTTFSLTLQQCQVAPPHLSKTFFC